VKKVGLCLIISRTKNKKQKVFCTGCRETIDSLLFYLKTLAIHCVNLLINKLFNRSVDFRSRRFAHLRAVSFLVAKLLRDLTCPASPAGVFAPVIELVPDDHLLRLIEKYIGFSFLLEKVVLIIVMITVFLLIPLFFLK
jgi:hypothetical protein